MKKLISLLAMLPLMVVGLWAQTLKVDASDPEIRYVGRTLEKGSEVSFDWAGTYLEMNFIGDGISLRAGDSGENFYNVRVDGVEYPVVSISGSDTTVVLASGLGRGAHTLMLQKRTEGSQGIATLKEFVIEGRSPELLSRPAVRERHIEFIGDSFTCGYGVEAAADERFSGATENCGVAHGALLAQMFDADYTFIANSGRGVVRNYGEGKTTSDTTMQQLMLRTLNSWEYPEWDSRGGVSYVPDMVVVFLGINDYSTEPSPSVREFKSGYRNLVGELRASYGDEMPILCIAPSVNRKVAVAIEEMKGELGDVNLYYMVHYDGYMSSVTDHGADGHPNMLGQRKIAMLSAPYISTIMNWQIIN